MKNHIPEHILISTHNGKPYVDNILRTEIKESTIHGFGLFAVKDIPKGTLLCHLGGQFLPSDFTRENYDKPSDEWNAVQKDIFLFRWIRTKYGFINHSSTDANCELYFNYPQLELRTLSCIKKNKELLLNYKKEELPEWYLDGHGKTYL